MAPPTHPLRRSTDPLDLDLDLRDGAAAGSGVIDLSARMRPVGGRRSSRQTHTRLLAALARIQANSLGANSLEVGSLEVGSLGADAGVADDLVTVEHASVARRTDR